MSEKKTGTNDNARSKEQQAKTKQTGNQQIKDKETRNQRSMDKPVKTAARKRSRTATGVLALIFGGLGISKFYEGKYVQGVLCLLFFWTGIPGIFIALEGTHIMATDEDEAEGECEINA